MESLATFFADKMSGWDFLIAGVIVLVVEYLIKPLFKNTSEKTQGVVMKVAPVVLAVLTYVVICIIEKGTWYTAVGHGLIVGCAAMGFYDIILKTIKEKGAQSLTNLNAELEKVIDNK